MISFISHQKALTISSPAPLVQPLVRFSFTWWYYGQNYRQRQEENPSFMTRDPLRVAASPRARGSMIQFSLWLEDYAVRFEIVDDNCCKHSADSSDEYRTKPFLSLVPGACGDSGTSVSPCLPDASITLNID